MLRGQRSPTTVVARVHVFNPLHSASDGRGIVTLRNRSRMHLDCVRGGFDIAFGVRGCTLTSRIRCTCVLGKLRGS